MTYNTNFVDLQLACNHCFSEYILAGSENAPESELKRLAHSNSARVRQRVAENANTPLIVLEILTRDEVTDVKVAVSENPSTPLRLQYLLAGDCCADVRFAMAENHMLPEQVLFILARDENPFVSIKALDTLEQKFSIPVCSGSGSPTAALQPAPLGAQVLHLRGYYRIQGAL